MKEQNRVQKKFRILHFGYARTLGPGVKRQILSEIQAANRLEKTDWHSIYFSHDQAHHNFMRSPSLLKGNWIFPKLTAYINLRVSAYRWLLSNYHNYDAILLRYPLGDPFLAFYARKLNHLFTIHHTKELDEIKSHRGLVSIAHQTIENIVSKVVLRKVQGIVGLTKEILDYELNRIKFKTIPGFVSSNGINTTTLSQLSDKRKDNIKLVCICSKPYAWQGLDLVVSELINSDIQNVELHFIGDITAEVFGNDPRIFYHGMLTQSELEDCLSIYDLGLGSFALYRKAMTEACTLKTRDYLASGIPVYANHVDSGLPEDFPFFINQPFNLKNAVELANSFRGTTKDSIREASLPYIDKQHLLEDLAEWIALKTSTIKN